jgi:hypothetical protein
MKLIYKIFCIADDKIRDVQFDFLSEIYDIIEKALHTRIDLNTLIKF